MKNQISMQRITLTLTTLILFNSEIRAQNIFPAVGPVGIGTMTPDASSILDIKAGLGVLLPRMTQVDRNAIVSPATGLLIFQKDYNPGFYYYTGTQWNAVTPQKANLNLSNLTAPSAVNIDLLPNLTNAVDLGSVALNWKDLYISGKIYSGSDPILSTQGNNLFAGRNAGKNNSLGNYNTACGFNALYSNTTGNFNTASGWGSLFANTTGVNNTGCGSYSLQNNTTGVSNTACGFQSLLYNTTGNRNVACGVYSLGNNSTGNWNTASGSYSLHQNTTGNGNTAHGANALNANTTGYSNVAVGNRALYGNTVGSNMVAIGDSALYNQSVNAASYYSNTAIGSKALFANTTGYFNTANGSNALQSNTTGNENTATGGSALGANTTGFNNSAFGYNALGANIVGRSCSAFGSNAGKASTASFNSFFGANSGFNITTGGYNSFFGTSSGFSTTTGAENCLIGVSAGNANVTGNQNTCVGRGSNVGSSNLTNASAFGYNASVNASNKIRLGNAAVATIEGNVVYTVSDGRFKTKVVEEVKGLDFINKLRPVVYNFEAKKFDQFLNKNMTEEQRERTKGIDYSEAEKIRYSGFIAQEVEQAAKQTGYDFNGVHVAQNSDDNYSLAYAEFTVPLVKAVQELSSSNDEKNKLINQLQNKNVELENKIEAMHSCLESLCSANELKSTAVTPVASPEMKNSLDQNQPNPFSEKTVIGYSLAPNNTNAKIIIRDLNGNALREFTIAQSEKGSVTVNANELAAGTYTYSLFVNNRCVDTKLMVITR